MITEIISFSSEHKSLVSINAELKKCFGGSGGGVEVRDCDVAVGDMQRVSQHPPASYRFLMLCGQYISEHLRWL